MKNFLKSGLVLTTFLFTLSACSTEEPHKDVVLVPNEEPTVGEVIVDKITPKDKSEDAPTEDGFVHEPTSEEVPVAGPEPSAEDYATSIKVIKLCDDLVHSITKNVPDSDKNSNLGSTYEKTSNGISKVTVNFDALDAKKKRTSYTGTCEFDSQNTLTSFSAVPTNK